MEQKSKYAKGVKIKSIGFTLLTHAKFDFPAYCAPFGIIFIVVGFLYFVGTIFMNSTPMQ